MSDVDNVRTFFSMDKINDKWVCKCGKKAVGHTVIEGIHYFMCVEHWTEYLDLPTRRKKNARNNTRLAGVVGSR